jgi:hypothetical protein
MSISNVSYGFNPLAVRVRYTYTNASGSTKTIREGEPMCFNYDTTTNWCGFDPQNSTHDGARDTTTADGYQNEGKYLLIENPASGNLNWFAGAVACGSWCGKSVANGSSLDLDLFIPNGAILPIRTNANCTANSTVLGVGTAGQYFEIVTGDDDPLPVALVEETVDRSSTNGLVLARLHSTAQPVSSLNAVFTPTRAVTTGDASGVRIICDSLFTGAGTAGPRTWGLYVTGDKESGAISTAGADDAGIRVSISNYVANGEVFNWRGLNVSANNRSGGVVGELDNTISVSAKQGSTNAKIIGLQVDAQSLSADTADEMVGLDVSMNREGGVSTEEACLRLRTRGTINTAINTAIRVDKGATDHGFINLFNIESDAVDYSTLAADITWDTSDIKIPVVINGTTYYLVAWAGT